MNTPALNSATQPANGFGLWTRLRNAWAALRGNSASPTPARSARATQPKQTHFVEAEALYSRSSQLAPGHRQPQQTRQPYNLKALSTARDQWQRGDWASLADMTLDELQNHPDRAKLALLAAAGHLQLGQTNDGADCLYQAKAWGCSPLLMRQVVVAGVHNTLGKAAALADKPERAEQHFAASLQTVIPLASGRVHLKQRADFQLQAMQLQLQD